MKSSPLLIRGAWVLCMASFALTPVCAAEPLAQSGFMERPGTPCTLFGFTSQVATLEPGIWGALMLTEKQGTERREIWHQTQGRRISEKTSGQEAKDVGKQFGDRRAEILTSEQKSIITAINQLGAQVQAEVKNGEDPQGAVALFRESLSSVLTAEQLKAAKALERLGPQVFPDLIRCGRF